jgi:hypothetical protein
MRKIPRVRRFAIGFSTILLCSLGSASAQEPRAPLASPFNAVSTTRPEAREPIPAASESTAPVAPSTMPPIASHLDKVSASDHLGLIDADATPSVNAYGPAPRQFWFQADYLMWWIQGAYLPPLLTASPPGTPRSQAGVLGAPGTTVLIGGERQDADFRQGYRLRLGGWCDDCQQKGFEIGFFSLCRTGDSYGAGSDGSQILSRPFFDPAGVPNAELVSFPGVLAGGGVVNTDQTSILGFEALCRQSLCRTCDSYLDLLAGYRYLRFNEQVSIIESLIVTDPSFPAGTTFTLEDRFRTRNYFNGATLGLAAGTVSGRCTFDVRGQLSFGKVCREVDISGHTTIASTGTAPVTYPGGLLTQSSNIGMHRSSDWTVIPELELNAGYRITDRFKVRLGYSFIYLTKFARAGDQIDTTVNSSLIPPGNPSGPARPAYQERTTDFWMQGFNLGAEWQF